MSDEDYDSWPCPQMMQLDDTVELVSTSAPKPFTLTYVVSNASRGAEGLYELTANVSVPGFLFSVKSAYSVGLRWRVVTPTLSSIPVAKWPPMNCARCNEQVDHAEPNKPDGKTFVCFGCRTTGWSVTWGPRFEQ